MCVGEQVVGRAALFVCEYGSLFVAMPEALLLGKAGITSPCDYNIDHGIMCDPPRRDSPHSAQKVFIQ